MEPDSIPLINVSGSRPTTTTTTATTTTTTIIIIKLRHRLIKYDRRPIKFMIFNKFQLIEKC